MAQEGGKSEIGAVSVSIDGNIAPLQAKLAQAKKETEDAARIMASETQRSINGRAGAAERGVAGSERSNVEAALRAERNSAAEMQSMAETVAKADQETDGLFKRLNAVARQAMIVVRVLGLMAAAAKGVATVVGSIHNYFHGAEIAATRFLASLGEGVGAGAQDRLKAIRQEVIELDKAIDKKSGRSILDQVYGFFSNDTINKARGQQKILYQELRNGDKQLKAQRSEAYRTEGTDLNVRAWVQAEEARLKKNEEYYQRRMSQKKLQIEQEREIEDDAFDKAEDSASKQQERMLDLASGARAASERNNPLRALDNEARDQAAAIMAAWQNARDPVQKMLIQMFGAAIIGGIKAEKAQIEAALKNTIIDAVNAALQASGGTGSSAFANMTVQLSEIAAMTRAINMNIPRDSP